MDTQNTRSYEYFLPTEGINIEQARTDLRRIFAQPGETYTLQTRSIEDQPGIYVLASLQMSQRVIAALRDRTPTPLERLVRVETRIRQNLSSPRLQSASTTTGFSDTSRRYPTEHSVTMSPGSTQRVPMSAVTMYGQSAAAQTLRYHANMQGSAMTPQYQQPSRYPSTPNQYIPEMSSYSALQLYQETAVEAGYEQNPREGVEQRRRTNSSGGSGNTSVPNSDVMNDTFYFPPNVVSRATVEQRRERLRRDSNQLEEPNYR